MKTKLFIIAFLSFFAFNTFAGPNEELITACKKGDIEAVKAAIASGADVNFLDAEGFSTLSYAVFWVDIVQILIDKGADVSKGKMPPFVQASNFMSIDVMKLLLAKGADPKKEADYETSVDMGAFYKQMADNERAKGNDANQALIKSFDGMSNTPPVKTQVKLAAFTAAFAMGHKECLAVLAAANVKLNAVDEITAGTAGKRMQDFVFTAKSNEVYASLMPGAVKGYEDKGIVVPDWYKKIDKSSFMSIAERLDLLIKAGFDVNKKYDANAANTTFGRTALSLAFDEYMPVPEEIALLIIKAGGNVNEEDEKYGPIINLAAKKGYVNAMKAMVAAGADINAELKKGAGNTYGFTPLIMAALNDQVEVATYLIKEGVKNSEGAFGYITDKKGACYHRAKNKTALYFAIEHQKMDMVKLLVESSGIDWSTGNFSALSFEENVGGGMVKCRFKGKHTPSEFASALFEKGNMYAYLKSKGL